MAQRRTYNTFYKGTQQDDFLTGGANFIDTKNIDGIRDGYFTTLGSKSQKQITTLDEPLSMDIIERQGGFLNYSFVGDASGNIYKFTGTDNTPNHILTSGDAIVRIVNFNNYHYFFNQAIPNNSGEIARILSADIVGAFDDWSGIDDSFALYTAANNPPVLIIGDFMYYGSLESVRRLDTTDTIDVFDFVDDNVVGLTLQGTTIKVYVRSGKVYYWDGTSESYSSAQDYNFRISSVESFGGVDYITSEGGDFYISSGYQVQRITKAQESLRLENNTDYGNKLDFEKTDFNGVQMGFARGDVYVHSNQDTNPGLYKYGRLIPGLPQGFHKILSKDNTGTDIEEFFSVQYYEREISSMFFSYYNGTTYGVDFIDLKDLTTQQDGFLVTDVFTGGTTFNKKIDRLRLTTSYTSGDNYVKLYKRYNNATTWDEVITINESTDEIKRKNISSLTGDFVDVQFKIEIHNDNQDNTPPLVHEFSYDYTIIQQ